jgi:hypothetical protein
MGITPVHEDIAPVFYDCITHLERDYCLSFKIDSTYHKDTYAATGGGLTKSYRFVSSLDTVVVEFYIWEYKKNDGEIPVIPTTSYRNKLLKDYGCEIINYENLSGFFEGSLVYCQSKKLEFLEYSGIKHLGFNTNAVGVVISSIGEVKNSSKRHRTMKDIIKSIKVDFEPHPPR